MNEELEALRKELRSTWELVFISRGDLVRNVISLGNERNEYREVLEKLALGESQFDNVEAMHAAREVLAKWENK